MIPGTMLSWLSAAAPQEAAEEAEGGFEITEMILHHLADSSEWETPFGVLHLDEALPLPTLHFGGLEIDLTITKHVLFMLIAAVLVALMLILAARGAAKEHEAGARRGPKGAANVVEAFVLYLRDEVALQNIGRDGQRYVPFIVTLFFFILFCNLLGLLPWGTTPTGNISVTAALALLSLIVIEVAGMLSLGVRGYARTVFYAPSELAWYMKVPMYLIMSPVEFMGKFTKIVALAIRLYANMTAGHAVVLALTGLLVIAGLANSLWVAPAPIIMAVAIMLLEIFIAFLQAYIFALLSAVFIGLIRHPAH